MQEAGSIQVALPGDLYAGLFVNSHSPKIRETAVFSGVSIEALPRKSEK
ncbi:MAG: hypothetical protein ABI165_21740 [Bryobacteraceae bacterium]